jgi:hypothetical protein
MEDNMMEIGLKTKCKAKESILGQMVVVMKASIIKIKSMDMELIAGQMVEFMKDIGMMECSTEKENIHQGEVKQNLEYGRTVRDLDGCQRLNNNGKFDISIDYKSHKLTINFH